MIEKHIVRKTERIVKVEKLWRNLRNKCLLYLLTVPFIFFKKNYSVLFFLPIIYCVL